MPTITGSPIKRWDAAKVVFLAFNANGEKTSVAEVMAASKKWSMEEIPTGHFLTGSADELKAVWNAYGVLGSVPPKRDKPNEKQHSPAFFVIDQAWPAALVLFHQLRRRPYCKRVNRKTCQSALDRGEARGKLSRIRPPMPVLANTTSAARIALVATARVDKRRSPSR